MRISGLKLIVFGFFVILILIGFAFYAGVLTENIITGDQEKTENTRFTVSDNEEQTQEDKTPSQPDISKEQNDSESEVGSTTEPEEEDSEESTETDPYEVGEAVFSGNCIMCHGEMGANGKAPNLQTSKLAESYENVVNQVKNGGTYMPPFEEELSTEEIEAVAKYVNEVLNKADE